MRVDATKLLLLTFVHGAVGRLLQINEWHEIYMEPGGRATLDISLFMSCERFSMLFASEGDEMNRLNFIFDGEDLQKIDIDSPTSFEIPSPPLVIGGCRETNRKFLRVEMISRAKKIEFRLHEQVIIRPKRNSSNLIKILFPQKGACCMIRGLLLMDDDKDNFTHDELVVRDDAKCKIRPTNELSWENTRVKNLRKTSEDTSTSTTDPALVTETQVQSTPKPTTSVHEYQLISWTDMVNREWSTSFLICSISILIVMISMITFGLCMFIYLQTRPNGGKKIYSIED